MAGTSTPNLPGRPFMGGDEVLAADLNPSAAAQLPETMGLTALQVSNAASVLPKNRVIGGDFTTNMWQRGTTSGTVTNTLTYGPDMFFAVGGASSAIVMSRQALSAGDIDAGGNRFGNSARVARTAANADTAAINFGTVLETLASRPMQGKQVTLSFWGKAGATYSPAGGLLGVQAFTGTGTDQSAANMVAGSWTGSSSRQLAVPSTGVANVGGGAAGNPSGTAAATILTNVSAVALTTAWTRYQLTFSVPATATQIGLLWTMTPVGTAGATDFFELAGVQLEMVTADFPFATPFEFRHPMIEVALQKRYCHVINEPAATIGVGMGQATGANAQQFVIALPVTMRAAPTITFVTSGASWRVNVAGTPTAVTPASVGSTADAITISGGAANTNGQAVTLQGNGGTGAIVASANL